MRFDVPVVGVPTIETMIAAGATCLSVTAGKTLIFDRDEMIKLADKNKISYRRGINLGNLRESRRDETKISSLIAA